ncbi:MAG: Mur ligase domain-containing protein, partial [Pseudomonadota bacterium]
MAGSGAEAGAPLWGAEEAAAATGGRLAGAAGWAAQAVSIDSREIDAEAGAPPLFVALEGLARDGHAFVADALARGAAAALVSRRPDGLDPAAPLLLVDDTLRALERLAAAARARPGPEFRAIAVTGSVGKTSTKDMLARML